MGRTIPFHERHRPAASPAAAEPSPLVGPDGRPARVPASADCPQCGADADHRTSNIDGTVLTCQQCGYEGFTE
jgi:rubredoxin